MDGNNWRPTGQPQAPAQAQPEQPPMDGGDWRAQLQPESRQRIVNKIMDTLKRHLPFAGQEGTTELKKIAVRFEEKIYTAATSQSDYLRKISLKMLTMETKSQNTSMNNPIPPNPQGSGSRNLPDSVSQSMPTQAHNPGQSLSVPLANNQSQPRQHLMSQNIQNNIASAGVQSSAGLSSTIPAMSNLGQASMPNVGGQNSIMQNISGMSQNTMGNSMAQGVASNTFVNSQRQMQGRQLSQQGVPQQQQQQQQQPQPQQQQPQQPQNSQQYLYQQQFQHPLLKQNFQGNIPQSLMQSHMQQQQHQQPQQQQNLLQQNPLQSSQQPLMQSSSMTQPSMMQSVSQTSLHQNQQPSAQQSAQSVLQQHQSVLRQSQQAPLIHQQQTAVTQQQILPSQQQQQLMGQQHLVGQQQNATSMQQTPLLGQQNSVSDMQPQQQQQQQRLLGQQNNVSNIHQQQQLMAHQNNMSNVHQQQLSTQGNSSGVQQQQQLVGTQSGNSLQSTQHSGHMLQQPKQNPSLVSTQGQPSQGQQQLLSQIQSQPSQIQQPLGMQQQPPLLQRDVQQRLQTSGVLHPQNVMDQPQKQIYHSQRAVPEGSSTSLDSTGGNTNGGDWHEEVYQKIKTMKELFLPDLSDMYQKIAAKLQQQDPQQTKPQQLEKFKMFTTMLEHVIGFLQCPRSGITTAHRDKLGSYEKQIINFLNTNRPRKVQQSQLPPPHMQGLQQPQQSQSQITQVQPHENQLNPQMQAMMSQGSVAPMQQNNVTNLQHSTSSFSGVSTGQPGMMNPLHNATNIEPGQANALSSLQQANSVQQKSSSGPQQRNFNALTSQNGVNMLQANMNSHQSNSNMLQHPNLKPQQEQQMLLKQQLHQRQLHQLKQQQMLQQQQAQQQQPESLSQTKQSTQAQANQIPQLHQLNDLSELKLRHGLAVKPEILQQHPLASQRAAYHHQQIKPGASFPISSPMLQSLSPQISQPSPQLDQHSRQPKAGTPFPNSPYVIPSPSTPIAPSPMPVDSEKNSSTVSSALNQQLTVPPAQSIAIVTPGLPASPLLEELDNYQQASTTAYGKATLTEQPLERLLKAVKSMSPEVLSASVSDISSVVTMVDRIAGSAPGNGSRAAVGEDLVAMTKCRLQARNIASQDGTTGTKKIRRYTSAMPLNVTSSTGSVNDSFKLFTSSDTPDLESTATSLLKRPRIEANHALVEEIREINQRLIDTVVDITDDDVDPKSSSATAAEEGEGVIILCSFNAVALSPTLKSQYTSAQMSPIPPLRMLVPTNYPNCSPVLLDKFPVEVSKESDDLSVKAKARFGISLRNLSQPMSVGEIARTWDVCARTVISDYAQQSGGGSFSSRYGTWDNCLSAA